MQQVTPRKPHPDLASVLLAEFVQLRSELVSYLFGSHQNVPPSIVFIQCGFAPAP